MQKGWIFKHGLIMHRPPEGRSPQGLPPVTNGLQRLQRSRHGPQLNEHPLCLWWMAHGSRQARFAHPCQRRGV